MHPSSSPTIDFDPFKNEILTIGLDDNLDIKDFFVPDLVSDSIRSQPGFIHLDLSLTGDRTGISLVTIEGTKQVKQYNKVENEVRIEDNVDLVYRQVFTIGIQAPANSEISLEKTRQFIYYLKSIGFNIQGISADGFQSADMLQKLKIAGFNTKLISLDRSPAGYLAFRAAINEERLNLLDLTDSYVETELVNLEQDGMSGRVDHPSDGCVTGGTIIRLSDGSLETVDDLLDNYKGKSVVTINEETLEREVKPIENVFFTKVTDRICKLVLNTNELIQCTPDHRFMLRDGSWIEAQYLTTDDELMTLNKDVKVLFNHVVEESVSVYDLTIKDNHNYPLKSGIISHNSKDLADGLCGAMYNASLSGVSTSIRYAADDASIVNDIMVSDNEFIEDLNSMLDLGPSTTIVEEKSSLADSGGNDSLLDYLYDDMVW